MDFLYDPYHRPTICEKCGGVMVFKGVGEYECEDCKHHQYDDYGLVRNYVEANKGATAADIEAKTGVKQRTIRQMLRESRLEVSLDSKAFMHCEICDANIRSGRFCPKCEAAYHRKMEEQARLQKNMKGFGMGGNTDRGEKRFTMDEDKFYKY